MNCTKKFNFKEETYTKSALNLWRDWICNNTEISFGIGVQKYRYRKFGIGVPKYRYQIFNIGILSADTDTEISNFIW